MTCDIGFVFGELKNFEAMPRRSSHGSMFNSWMPMFAAASMMSGVPTCPMMTMKKAKNKRKKHVHISVQTEPCAGEASEGQSESQITYFRPENPGPDRSVNRNAMEIENKFWHISHRCLAHFSATMPFLRCGGGLCFAFPTLSVLNRIYCSCLVRL